MNIKNTIVFVSLNFISNLITLITLIHAYLSVLHLWNSLMF